MKRAYILLAVFIVFASFSFFDTEVSSEGDAYTVIYMALENHEEKIDLRGVNCDKPDFIKHYAHILDDTPEFFYVGQSVEYIVDKDGKVISATPEYLMDENQAYEAMQVCENWIKKALFLLDEDMTDYDKALFFHDYICANFEYDISCQNNDLYSFICEKTGNCRAYTMAYSTLLRASGIKCTYAASVDMAHIWNLVKLDGAFYHVDLTWDDIPGEAFAHVSHENFLMDDTTAKKAGHYGWQNYDDIQCTSNIYSSKKLSSIKGSMAYLHGYWYCASDEIYIYDVGKDSFTATGFGDEVLCVVTVCDRLAYCERGDIKLSDGRDIALSGTVCGIRVSGVTLEYAIEEFGFGRVPYSAIDVMNITRGDANGDGEVNAYDVILCNRFVCGLPTISQTDNGDADEEHIYKYVADLDRDGDIDNEDIMLLRRLVVK